VPFCQLVITATIVVITVSTVIAIFTIVSIRRPSSTFIVVLCHWSRRMPMRI
jgi:integral membrane sensor domain MASE1